MPNLTPKQVSEELGISLSLVYREIRAGNLRCHRFGKRTYRISEEHLATYLAESETAEPTDQRLRTNRQSKSHGRSNAEFKHIDVTRLLAERS